MSFDSSKFSLTFKEVGETIIYPFRYVFIVISDGITSLKESFSEREDYKTKFKNAEQELLSYKAKLLEFEKMAEENKRLKTLLGYKEEQEWPVDVAKIIARDPESNFSGITIDKGRKNGILPGMPVFAYMNNNRGVVGMISESALFTSKVRTFRDSDFSIGVYLPYSNVHGIAEGAGDNKNSMSLLYVDKDININLREAVMTSSEGALFPPNILLGTISFIDTTDKTRLTHKAYLRPYIHLSQIQDVFIIKKITPSMQE